MRRLTLACSLFASLLLAGCVQQEPTPPGGEQIGEDDSAIINGQLDNAHPGVVAVLGNNYSCTGTIVQIKGSVGYVLTAGHCCPAGDLPKWIVVGTDYSNAPTLNIIPGTIFQDSCYQDCPGSTDDVCMVKFSGATAGMQVFPVMTPQTDNLAIGTPITYVGYGLTASPPNGGNSKRRVVTKAIASVDSYFVEYDNAGASGTCQGDSGGPGLVLVNGVETVASVTSFGDQACLQLGASIRTSTIYNGFIAPYLQDLAPAPSCPWKTDCNVCAQSSENSSCSNGGGDCAAITNSCFQDPQCNALVQCYQGCGTFACTKDCNNAHLGGLQAYEKIEACLCKGSCAAACGQNSLCTGLKCGTKPKAASASCTTCVEDTCCAATWACSVDAACKKCFSAVKPDASCATNPLALAYYQCVSSACSGAGCMLSDPANPSGSTTSSSTTGGGTTAVTTGAGVGGAGGGVEAGVGGAGDASTAVGTTGATGTGGSKGTGGAAPIEVGGCSTSGQSGGAPGGALAALVLGAFAAFGRRRRA